MGRLIDADKIIDKLGFSDREIYCKCLIEEQPTAFDVDVVVDVVKGVGAWLCAESFCDSNCDSPCKVEKMIGRIVDVIRKGGVKNAK